MRTPIRYICVLRYAKCNIDVAKSEKCEPKLSFDYSKLMIILTTYYIAINLAQLMDVNAKCTFFLDTTVCVCVCVLLFNLRISIVWDALFFRDLKNFVKRKLPKSFSLFFVEIRRWNLFLSNLRDTSMCQALSQPFCGRDLHPRGKND